MIKKIKVVETVVRTRYVEYDEKGLSLAKKLTDDEILSDIASAINELGLDKISTLVDESVDSIYLDNLNLKHIVPQSIKDSHETS